MTDFLLLATVLLISGVIAVPLATKLGLGSVLGYLIAGIAISPVLALLHVDVRSLQHFAEFGVVMMLFLVGLELEPKKLWAMRDKLLGLGGLQVLGTALVVMAIAMALGQRWSVGLAIGLVFALSSTAIVLQTLNEKRLLNSDGGQSSFSVLLFQDIAVIPMLAFIPLLALPELVAQAGTVDVGGQGAHSINLVEDLAGWQVAIVTVVAVAFVLFVGTYLTRPLFRFIALAGLREMFTAAGLMIVIGIALLMSLVGLSPALGTFLAGVVLANSEYRHELEADINPFKGLLLGLFFITVGASINFDLLFSSFGTILALTIGLMLVKALVLFVLASMFKLQGFNRWLLAVGLAQAGEFGFVLLSFTVANHVVPAGLASQLMLVVALSMLLTPICFIVLEKVFAARLASKTREADEIDEHNDVLIIGNGRVGGLIRRILTAAGYKSTVVDYSASQLEMLRKYGIKAYYGDGRSPELLHAAGIDKAKVLVVAMDDKASITDLVRYICQNYPKIHVVARAIDRFHVYDLWAVGCRDMVRETYDSSLRMGRSVFHALGYSIENAQEMVNEFDKRDRKAMFDMASLYRSDIPTEENQAFLTKMKEFLDEYENELIGKGFRINPGRKQQ
ncbi:MAG: monovalent cation:proton antiporter-2 (CPA2) family protein [Acidiferrobacterales bacterium]|nr:monovalent cation:proton antiporter-2 (CPA2) family protein [Acidiferrobacterales bacterium]